MVDDLFSTIADGSQPSFLSDFVLQFSVREFQTMIEKGLSVSAATRFSYLMRGGRNDSIYHSVFSRIDEAKNLDNPIYLNAAKFLVLLLDAYNKLELIEGYETVEAAERSMSQGRNLFIIPSDINNIFNFLDHPQKDPIVYDIKASKF